MTSWGYGFSGAPRHPGGGGGWEPSARMRAIRSQLRARGRAPRLGPLPGTSTLFWPGRMESRNPYSPRSEGTFRVYPSIMFQDRPVDRGVSRQTPFSTKVLQVAPGPDHGESVIPVRL